MDGKLFGEVIRREEGMAGIEPLLILTVAALHLAVVSGRIGTDELMADTELSGSDLKESGQLPPAVEKTVGKFKAGVGLDTFYPDASVGIQLEQPV